MNKPFTFYAGDGAGKQFDIPFPYLRRDHILVFVNGEQSSFSWINASRIELPQAPPANVIVKIERHTPQAPLHQLQNNRPVAAEQFMELALQAMYHAQEQIAFVAKGDKGDKGDMGDMNKATYDPALIQADMFHMDNMVEGANTKILTLAERSKIASAVQPSQLPLVFPARFHIMEFTSATVHAINWPSWVTPDTPVHVTAWGGGGGGCQSGGGGGECIMGWFKRSQFTNNSLKVGSGGLGFMYNSNGGYGNNGGDTTVGGFLTAKGGYGSGLRGAYGSYDIDVPQHGGTGGGISGGYRDFDRPRSRDSTYGGGCGGDGTGANGRWYSGGNSHYGGGAAVVYIMTITQPMSPVNQPLVVMAVNVGKTAKPLPVVVGRPWAQRLKAAKEAGARLS